jgi:hypothetical protein
VEGRSPTSSPSAPAALRAPNEKTHDWGTRNLVILAIMVVRGRLRIALNLAIRDDRITEIDVIADPARVHRLDVAAL